MARLMLSAGMFSALAAATAVRRRGFFSTSPPLLAAMVISLIRRVKILPRLASSAPFLCLIVAHFEWPDMRDLVRHEVCVPVVRTHASQKKACMGHPATGQRTARTGQRRPARSCRAKQDYSIGLRGAS